MMVGASGLFVVELELVDGSFYDEGEDVVNRMLGGRIDVERSRCYRRELPRHWSFCRLIVWGTLCGGGKGLETEVIDGFKALKVDGRPYAGFSTVKGVRWVDEGWMVGFERDNKSFIRVW